MRGQVIDRASDGASGCCLDQVSLELAPEVAANALDQARPGLAQGFRLGRSRADVSATAEVSDGRSRGRHRLTRCGELVELSQELFNGVCDFAGGCVTLAYTGVELTLRFVQPLQAGERLPLLDESLFELADGALGDGDVSCGLGFSPLQVCDRILALTQPELCTLEFLLESGHSRLKLLRFR